MLTDPKKNGVFSSLTRTMPHFFAPLLLLAAAIALEMVSACRTSRDRTPNAVTEDATKVAVRWTTSDAEQERVRVGLVIAETPVPLGVLEGASDMETGGAATCDIEKRSESETRLTCGCTPYYNFLTLTLRDGELTVMRTSGVNGDPPENEKNEVIFRRKTNGKELALQSTPTAPGHSKSCKPHGR
jgi:hypothetical protein